MWEDIFIQKQVPIPEVAAGIAHVLGVKPKQVRVISGLLEIQNDDVVDIVVRAIQGDCALEVSIYLVGPPAPREKEIDTVACMQALARFLGSSVILSATSDDPFENILVPLDGLPKQIRIDMDQFSDTGVCRFL